MNLNVFSALAVSVPLSLALISACGGTADVGSDRSNVNASGAGNETGGADNGGADGTGGDTVTPGAGGASKAGSPGTAGGSQHGQAGSNQGGAAQGGAPGAGGMTGHAGSGAGGASGGTCGGLLGAQCGTGEFCDFADPICGAADGTGTCTAIPEVCDQIYAPVCGCDGQFYANECMANMAGVDASADKTCLPHDGGTGAQCATDADCRVADDYCHGGCGCVGLSAGEKAPTCADPTACLVRPCSTFCNGGECAAHCDNGVCVAR